MEWTDPRYAEAMKALRRAQQARQESGEDDARPMRGFLIPPPPDGR